MRKLKTRDIPEFCRVLKKLGLKDKFKDVAQKSDTMEDAARYGIDLVWDLFDAATEDTGEKALYGFLAGPFEMTADEVEDMDMADLLAGLKQLTQENDLMPFFKLAAKSMR